MDIGTSHARRVRVPPVRDGASASARGGVKRGGPKAAASKGGQKAAAKTGRPRSGMARDKRAERERRMVAKRRRDLLRATLLTAAVAAMALAATWLYRSPILVVETVEVRGAGHLTEDRVREIAAVPAGATLLRLPADEIEARLDAEPWIAASELQRRPPHTLRIVITEREPAALLDTGGATLWLVDRSGAVIAERSPEETAALVVVRDVPDAAPEPGATLDAAELANALAVIRGLSPELRSQVRAVAAPTVDNTALYTHDDVEVFVGSSEQLELKDLVVRRILEEQKGKVVYINVRTVDRPTWRGLDSVE